MRRFFSIIFFLFLLAGCASSGSEGGASAPAEQARHYPKIPQAESLKASVLEADKKEGEFDDLNQLLKEIEKDMNRPNISTEDILRGWYYGGKEDKKYGTPEAWIFVEDGEKSRWISGNALDEEPAIEKQTLCKDTAGTFVTSCLDSEVVDCEYIPESTCRCIEGSKWQEGQGCIMADDENEFIEISEEEKKRGWYEGLPNQKKLNTPPNWIWQEAGQHSRWQAPF